jgi:hypothetical protein
MTDKIPGFYYDLIVRIAPGGLLIVIYYRSFIAAAVAGKQFEGFLGGAIGSFTALVCAYIAGYLLESLAGLFIDCPHQWFSRRMKSKRLFGLLPSDKIWEGFSKMEISSPNKELFNLKELAERTLFRTLSFVSCVALVLELIRLRWGTDVLGWMKAKATVTPLPQKPSEDFYLWVVLIAAFLNWVTFIKIWCFIGQRISARNEVPKEPVEKPLATMILVPKDVYDEMKKKPAR